MGIAKDEFSFDNMTSNGEHYLIKHTNILIENIKYQTIDNLG